MIVYRFTPRQRRLHKMNDRIRIGWDGPGMRRCLRQMYRAERRIMESDPRTARLVVIGWFASWEPQS